MPHSVPSQPPAPKGKPGSQGGLKHTCLGLSTVQLNDVLDRLDGPGSQPSNRRQTRRLCYRRWPVAVILAPTQGSRAAIMVATRNISREGLSFLHSAYVHTDDQLLVLLRNQSGADVQVPAKVIRCRHVERHLHEVGVRFLTPINVHEFMPVDHVGAQFSLEVTDPGMLNGRLLLVADYEIDRKLIQHMLVPTKLEVTPAVSVEEALKAAEGVTFDVVLSDFDLGTGTGIDLFRKLRDIGMVAPTIIMSSDVSGTTRTLVREAKCTAFVNKPFTRDLLFSALAEFLLLASREPASPDEAFGAIAADSPLRPLAEKFAADARETAATLDQMLKNDRAVDFVRCATRLAGTASSLGFASLSTAAEAAIRAVNATGSTKEAAEAAGALIAACRRAESKAA